MALGFKNGKLFLKNGKICNGCCAPIGTCGCSPSSNILRIKLTVSWTELEWAGSTTYRLGQIVRYTDIVDPTIYYLFIKSNVGTTVSDVAAPTWDTTIGNTTTEAGSGIQWLRIVNTYQRKYRTCLYSNGDTKELCLQNSQQGKILTTGIAPPASNRGITYERVYANSPWGGELIFVGSTIRYSVGGGSIANRQTRKSSIRVRRRSENFSITNLTASSIKSDWIRNVRRHKNARTFTPTGCVTTTTTHTTMCSHSTYFSPSYSFCWTVPHTHMNPVPCPPSYFPSATTDLLYFQGRIQMTPLTAPSLDNATQHAKKISIDGWVPNPVAAPPNAQWGGFRNWQQSQDTDNIGVTFKWEKVNPADSVAPGTAKAWYQPA